jgi:hypothetical protein
MKVKQEKLEWLADNPFYSKRFAFFVGRRCRAMTIKDVAQETHLDWKTVKESDKQYMQEQLRRIGIPTPKVIGVALVLGCLRTLAIIYSRWSEKWWRVAVGGQAAPAAAAR